jgi:hypothetical protein
MPPQLNAGEESASVIAATLGLAARMNVLGGRIAVGFSNEANKLRPSMIICVFRHHLLPASVASSQLGYRASQPANNRNQPSPGQRAARPERR